MKMYINKKSKIAVKKDEDDTLLLVYDIEDGIVREETEGILRTTEPEIGEEIAEFFKINLADYGVELYSEDIFMTT